MNGRSFLNQATMLLGVVAFVAFYGCSPSASPTTGMDADFVELARRIQIPSVEAVPLGDQIGEKIVRIADTSERDACLEKFGDAILSVSFEADDYIVRNWQLGAVEELLRSYSRTLNRCGISLEKDLEFRLAFLERIRREIAHPLPGPERDRHPPGLFITEDVFLKNLRDSYDLHLRWLEEAFNRHAPRELPPDACARLRAKIEAAIGRRIRTDGEILRDRLRRPREADTPSNRPGERFLPRHDIEVPVAL